MSRAALGGAVVTRALTACIDGSTVKDIALAGVLGAILGAFAELITAAVLAEE